jgi:Holliday junction DNA helicase RuvA
VITFLHGKLCEALPTTVTVDVHGVGYEVLIPLSSFDRLPPVGGEIHLLTHLAVREDAHTLYGFLTTGERELFRLLIHTVSGIGPKLALNVLSGTTVTGFCAAVAAGDVKALSAISGVGRKTAERMVMELRDKLPGLAAGSTGPATKPALMADARLNDAVLALTALGFKAAEAHDAVRGAMALLGETAPVEQLVRACLKRPV